MIYYNFPYRGPFEYDKFIISILQYCNEVENIRETIDKDEKGFIANCKVIDDELDAIRKEKHAERLLGIIEMII